MRRLIGVATVLSLALALGACTSGDDVATLGGKSKKGAPTAEEKQAASAEALVACLKEAGVPAVATDADDGQKDVGFEGSAPYAVGFGDGGAMMSSGDGGLSQAEEDAAWERLEALVERYQPSIEGLNTVGGGTAIAIHGTEEGEADETGEAGDAMNPLYLIVGETDHTEVFKKCMADSDYTPPVWKTDPAEELKSKEESAKATAEWARCARDNDFPSVKDPAPPVADEYQTQPTAVLPKDITEAELRALLEVCPNFDEAKEQAYMDGANELSEKADATEEEWDALWEEFGTITPSIGFDFPGMDGNLAGSGDLDMDDPEVARLMRLQEVLYEKQGEFYERQGGLG